ncbi:hypothetical protein [Microbulbifer sp. ZKSA002]|uniref:hypothetical protein n=1 Tax=Microbulbifer sp. ZKSA002 TaxID=3243388 RepID=UPI00403A6301
MNIEVKYVHHMGTDLTVANAAGSTQLEPEFWNCLEDWVYAPDKPILTPVFDDDGRDRIADAADDKKWEVFRHTMLSVIVTAPHDVYVSCLELGMGTMTRLNFSEASQSKTWLWTGDVSEFMAYVRHHTFPVSDCSKESRQVSNKLDEICQTLFPYSWGALSLNL